MIINDQGPVRLVVVGNDQAPQVLMFTVLGIINWQ
jgi:hypothetical protein